jgi:hypothetical protein
VLFDRITTDVEIGEHVVFRFPQRISIQSLWVANRSGKVWGFISNLFGPVMNVQGSVSIWPADQAPAEVLSMLHEVREREHQRLLDQGPRYPLLTEVVYGIVPTGYREELRAQPLTPDEYNVGFFAEQGIGGTRFVVPPDHQIVSPREQS